MVDSKNCQTITNFCQSGENSPNLVTLVSEGTSERKANLPQKERSMSEGHESQIRPKH